MPSGSLESARWLLLIHQVPPKPDYLRVKVRRRLDRIGAVALKSSVYVLPCTESSVEDFQWLLREIVGEGGEASVCEAAFIEGLTDDAMIRAFRAARDADYAAVVAVAEMMGHAGSSPDGGEQRGHAGSAASLTRLRRRLDEVAAIDFFAAPERARANAAVDAAEARLRAPLVDDPTAPESRDLPSRTDLLRNRTWVTRRDVRVDRIASAWLIRRFLDSAARFKFVQAKGYRPKTGELCFDMYDAEYTHEGGGCTFETLLVRFRLRDRSLRAIGEIVHDIDLKETRFGRPETAGVATLIDGIVLAHEDDPTRLERGAAILDELHAAFRHRLKTGSQDD